MISSNYIKGALLVAVLALLTVHALPAEENSGKPADGTPIALDATNDPPSPPTSSTVTPDDKNVTTTSTTTSTTTTVIPPSPTPDTTTTPKTTTSEKPTTPTPETTTIPPTTTVAPTPVPNNGTTTEPPSPTTPAPVPVPHCKRFDPFSFIGGMILGYGSLAIMLVLYKFYKQHNPNAQGNTGSYRTL